jgi:2-polyprenyl-3-methyl-5-hydroxy-6-metoxy-1,4-benzoquinol methylase
MRDRVRVDERMDDPAIPAAEHDRALAGLMRLNAVSRSRWLLWPGIAALARERNRQGEPLRVVDIATGAGDGPIAMARRARRLGLDIRWTLCDASPHALAVARARADRAGVAIETTEADAIGAELPARGDLVTCSLFLHHCERADAVRVLRHMAGAAELAVAATDLDRTRFGLALAWLGSRALSRSPVVHFDATASVRGAFSRAEAAALARDAGLDGARVDAAFPARWNLWWRRGA